MKKLLTNNNHIKKNKEKKLPPQNLPYHLDDKGRRKFDFSKAHVNILKAEIMKKREENLNKNLNVEISTFKCEKCNLIFTDNIALKNHLNGKKHNFVIGNDLKIKQSTVESVREKLLSRKRGKEEKNKKIKN